MTWAVLLCVVIANSTLPFICGYVAFKCYKMPILPDPLDDEKADLTANAVRPDTSSHILLGPVTNAGGIIVGARSRLSFAPKVAATQIQPQFQKIYLNVGRANGHFTPVDKNPAGHLSSSNSSPATAPCQSNHGATLSRSGTKKLGPGATSTTLTSFGKTTLKRSATSGRKKVAMAVGPELEAVNAMTKTRQSRSQVPNEKSLNGQSIVKVDVQGLRNRGNRSVSREPKRPSWSDRESPTWNSVPMSSDNQSNDNSNGRRALPLSNAGKVISATRMNRSETKNDSTSNSRNTSSNTRSPSSNWKKSTSRPYSTTLAENQKQKEVQHQGNDELYSSDEEHDSEWEAVVPVSQNKRPPRRDSASNESMLESSNSRIISYYTGRSVRLVSDNSRQDSRVPRGSNNSRASRD
ncbi:hypothetical protein BC830DRAFT_562852 [Chytriomyces sp. MP71]|nr:hypothetical protein BC830DRAFT_562852 [Chytriomyces sp. MP71]